MKRFLLSWLRRRFEGLLSLLALPLLSLAWVLVGAIRLPRLWLRSRHREGSREKSRTTTLRRWGQFLRRGFQTVRERWWPAMAMERERDLWRYLLILELADLLNSIRPPRSPSPETHRSILVVNLAHMGDILHTVPMLRVLRNHFPNARIEFLAGPWMEELVGAILSVDGVFSYAPHMEVYHRGKMGKCRGFLSEVRLLHALRKREYDLMISCSSGHFIEWVLSQAVCPGAWLGAKASPGIPYHVPYTYRGVDYDSRGYEAARLLSLLAAIGIDEDKAQLEFAVPPEAQKQLDSVLAEKLEGSLRPLVAISPGAGWPGKIWPPDRFACVGKFLQNRFHAEVILVGAHEEVALAQRVAALMDSPPVVLAGQTTVPQLAALLKRCSLVIANDSGPMHMAVALDTPSIGLFGPGFPTKWTAPGARHVGLWHDVACTCWSWHPRSRCTRESPCISAITTAEVNAAIERLDERISWSAPAGRGARA